MTYAVQAAEEAARELVRLCCERGVTLSTAESCTAGLVSSTIADIPGASNVLRGGAVTYVDEIKHAVLGVSLHTLEHFTAVSVPCASEMAEGARRVFGSTLAVSTTGYAGHWRRHGGRPRGHRLFRSRERSRGTHGVLQV